MVLHNGMSDCGGEIICPFTAYPSAMTLRIGLTGDVMLGRLVNDRQQRRPPAAVWGNLRDHLLSLDGLFINLECCLSNRGEQWQRTYRPFHFRADPGWAISALRSVDVTGCALANNHILDYEEIALLDTLEALDEAGILHAGAGRTRADAFEPVIVSSNELRIGFCSFTDNLPEYAATADAPGTAHIKIDVHNDDTRAAVKTTLDQLWVQHPDLVIASLHWGPNMIEHPSESFREFGRWLLDQGVDVIHGHSAHIFQGIQVCNGAPILYDTGDFVDDYSVDDTLRNDRSFLFEIVVTETGTVGELRLVPTKIYDAAVHHAAETAANWSRNRMQLLSAEFGTTFENEDGMLVLRLKG